MNQRVLAPVLHKDAYTREVEKPVLAYFREIFAPLFIQLEAAGVPVDPKYQAIKFDEEGRENAKAMELYDPALGGLGLPRNELPQIAPEMRGALITFLAYKGVDFQEMMLLPSELKPTQEGFYPDAVERGRKFIGEDDSPLLVASDGHLLDGHHRWTTALFYAPNTPLRCWVFGRPVRTMLKFLNSFGGTVHENAMATGAVRSALESGQIHYADGKFTGRFSSAISKELRTFGAKFNAEQKTFSIPVGELPLDLSSSIAASIDKSRHLHEDVIQTLVQMEQNLPAAPIGLGLDLAAAVDRVVVDAGRQFLASVAHVDGIGVPAEFTPAMRKQLNQELTQSLELSVKDFTQEMVADLRQLVEQNALKGMRSDKLAAIIEAKFGVTKRKAEFLADQETGLLMAKYRQARYQDIGSQEYVWECSLANGRPDARVRPDHAKLQGRRFAWTNPPVCDTATGRRCNPGEDFRCRCVAKAIINLQALAA